MRFQGMTDKEIVAYFDSVSIKPYDSTFTGGKAPAGELLEIESIIDVNRDVESFVIQGSASQTPFIRKNQYEPLQFVHLSDVHAVLELWERMVRYVNHYSDYIAFALHTGDYCGDNQQQYADLYARATPCKRPVLNCVGNHDTITGEAWVKTTKEEPWKRLFNHTEDWDARFMDCPHSMSYYKDFPDSNIRLIVLDQYYDLDEQALWLEALLADAMEKKLWVITAMHEPTADITDPVDVYFQTVLEYAHISPCVFDGIIGSFIANGGQYICNLCGHEHHDLFGYTASGVLNVAVECACDWAGWCDGRRVRGTKTYDSFNVVTVDVDLGLLKLVRIGNNCDLFLRQKRVLCYDYRRQKVIANG